MTTYKSDLDSLLTLRFQLFQKAQFVTVSGIDALALSVRHWLSMSSWALTRVFNRVHAPKTK